MFARLLIFLIPRAKLTGKGSRESQLEQEGINKHDNALIIA